MKTSLYYFTGTGNSLSVAKSLAEKMSDVSLHSIPQVLKNGFPNEESDAVGIIFPCYYMTMPDIIKDFISQIRIPSKTYTFIAITSGGDPGNTFADVSSLFEHQGLTLNSAFSIPLADNSIILKTDADKFNSRLNATDGLLDQVARTVENRETQSNLPKKRQFSKTLMEHTTKFYLRNISRVEKKEADTNKCNQCGVCVKACPTDNIALSDNSVKWSTDCAECFACIHACSRNAIAFGSVKNKDNEFYRHPSVKLSEIVSANQ